MGTKKNQDYAHMSVLERYEKLISEFPSVERKGKTMPYSSVNGHMFSFLDKEGKLSIRLPEAIRSELIKKYKAELSLQHGRVMKEYLLVPEILFHDFEALHRCFEASYQYTVTLKPK